MAQGGTDYFLFVSRPRKAEPDKRSVENRNKDHITQALRTQSLKTYRLICKISNTHYTLYTKRGKIFFETEKKVLVILWRP